MNEDVNILVVEDSPTQAEQLKYLLEKRGYSVWLSVNGKDALQMVRDREPNLIISDIVMPEMDGYELCRETKRDDRLRHVPFILLTSLSDHRDIIKGLECGADNFITKPYDEQYLLSRIWHILSNRELRKAARMQVGIELFFGGQKHVITSDREQILDLLLCTYDAAVQKNQELLQAQSELRRMNENLEKIVQERTAALMTETGEKRLLENQFRQAQKMEAVGRLAAGVAHDFNNLLTVIMGRSELLQQRLAGQDLARKDAELILNSGIRAAALTRQLLAFSRQQVLQPRVLDLRAVVTNMEEMLTRLIGEDVSLATFSPPELGHVRADPGQIEQVIMNLVINSRDAMPKGGRITIETATVQLDETYARQHVGVSPGHYVVLAVTDTGTGMDAETQARLFEPFFTTKEQGKGTGLGLSTVFGIVQQSGGHISVYSELGHGTTFKVYLPRIDQPVETRPAVEFRDNRENRGSETILLVEDNTESRKLVREILELRGYSVLEARSSEDAVRICEQYDGLIHLLLTDIIMPGIHGPELAGRIAQVRPGMRVIYMSGYTDRSLYQQGILGSREALLQKPLTIELLERKVREVLDSSSPGKANG